MLQPEVKSLFQSSSQGINFLTVERHPKEQAKLLIQTWTSSTKLNNF